MGEALSRIRWGSAEIKGPVHTYRERLMLTCLQQYVTEGAVLDAGCGTGSLVLALMEKGFKVVGLEQSIDGLRWLLQKANSAGRRVTVVQSNVESIPFRRNTFDAIMCGEVLEHLSDDATAVANFYRVLKPGGVCVVTVPANPQMWSFCDEYAGHQRRYTQAELTRLFISNGFQVLDVENWGFPLIRLYQRFVFRPYIWYQRRKGLKRSASTLSSANRKGLVDIVAHLAALAFSIDNFFLRSHQGVGFLLVAQKLAED
jgi:2-polyprenyl-3-methyl-5-hydroxy-6-metoxy-1,4-benzoquinol methylase